MDGRGPSAIDPAALRESGFRSEASAGLFVGVSSFQGGRFAAVPFAVDDAVDLAHIFAVELGLLAPERCVLSLAGEPEKPATAERLDRLLGRGARRTEPHYTALYRHLGKQAREARPDGLLVITVASHGLSDQGGDFLLASDSLPERVVRTGLAVDEVFDMVARAGAPRRLVLLDACRERLTESTRTVGASALPEVRWARKRGGAPEGQPGGAAGQAQQGASHPRVEGEAVLASRMKLAARPAVENKCFIAVEFVRYLHCCRRGP